MKHYTIYSKKKYKINKTAKNRSFFQKGGKDHITHQFFVHRLISLCLTYPLPLAGEG